MRLAFIVSHPIQYYVPIYREMARRAKGQPESGERRTETGDGLQSSQLITDERTKGPALELTAEGGRPEAGGQMSEFEQRNSHARTQEDLRLTDLRVKIESGRLTTDDSSRISAMKVFYTWRDAGPARDVKFQREFAWDIPLMEGYDHEVVPNASSDPGTHHRRGLVNPDLVSRVLAWKPDAVHITGYNYVSHGRAIKELSKAGIPVLFRGDSHLLDGCGPWWRWQLKKCFLSQVYRWPAVFLCVGQANRDYYRAFGVPEQKLFHVPHTIDVARFAEPNEELEAKAMAWRRELGIPDENFVFLYAAKLEPRKRPMELLEAFLRADIPKTTLLFAGSGEIESALKKRAFESGQSSVASSQQQKTEDCKLKTVNSTHRVVFLPFQNQSVMPVVYRLGNLLVLPSGYGETWGLAVNEALACGRPSLVSDCVGCARDIIREGENGMVFRTDAWDDCIITMKKMADAEWRSKREGMRAGARAFDTACGVDALVDALRSVRPACPNQMASV